MRVIFLTHNYPRHPGDLAGGFLHPLALALQGAGVDLRVVAPSDRGQGSRDSIEGIPVSRVRYAPAAWETLAYTGQMARALRDPRGLLALAGLWRALRRGARAEAAGAAGPVVIHAHWWFPAGAAAPPEHPLVVTLHGTDGRLLERGGVPRWLGRQVLRRAAVVTAVSGPLARVAEVATGRAIPAHAIQGMPVPVELFHRTRGGGGIVCVARLTPQKRIHLLLHALARLRGQGLPLRLTIVGSGEELPGLSSLASDLGLGGQVRFAGQQPVAEVAGLLGSADLFVLPAAREGYGLAAAEALLAGVPVVACRDGGGLLDLVPPAGEGRVVEPSPSGIAEGIGSLLADPGAREAAWRAGARLRAALHPGAVAERALEWYRQALATAG